MTLSWLPRQQHSVWSCLHLLNYLLTVQTLARAFHGLRVASILFWHAIIFFTSLYVSRAFFMTTCTITFWLFLLQSVALGDGNRGYQSRISIADPDIAERKWRNDLKIYYAVKMTKFNQLLLFHLSCEHWKLYTTVCISLTSTSGSDKVFSWFNYHYLCEIELWEPKHFIDP